MSMLSSMTEKMRETADKVESFWHRNRDWLWRDSTTITRAVVELRDAADTIDYLRNTCNDLQSENEKLRKCAHTLEVANIDMASRLEDYIGQYDPTDAFVIEVRAKNERLREFAAHLLEYVDPAGYQGICNIECPASTRCRGKSTCAFPDWALEKAKELGIEVWTDE